MTRHRRAESRVPPGPLSCRRAAITPLDGSGTAVVGVTVIVISPVDARESFRQLSAPGPLTLKLKNVSSPVGSVVGIGVPPVPE